MMARSWIYHFHYLDAWTKHLTNNCPSFFGYGICEEPTEKEENTPRDLYKHWLLAI
ncbi:MAG: hypothetical protein QM768_19945 [Agriterribacter sp.]